jgi:exopolysaccharide biosynthesis protein
MLKKRFVIRIVLIVLLVLIGMFLYINGKEHKVIIDNKEIIVNDDHYKATADYKVWLDNKEISLIEKDKRIVAMITGSNHKIVIESIDNQELKGEKYERIFKLKNNESALINIPAMINFLDDWIIKTS